MLNIALAEARKESEIIAALEEAHLQHNVALPPPLGVKDHADQFPTVVKDVAHSPEALTCVPEHDVLVLIDLELLGRFPSRLRVRPVAAEPGLGCHDPQGVARLGSGVSVHKVGRHEADTCRRHRKANRAVLNRGHRRQRDDDIVD